MKKTSSFLILCAALVIVACEPGSANLRLVAPSSDLDYEIASKLAELLHQQGSNVDIKLTDSPRSGEAALSMLLAGDADLALVSNYLPYRDGVATVMPLYPRVLHIAYRHGRDSSSATTLLDQASVYAGSSGSASRLMFERIAARLHLADNSFSYVDQDQQADASDADVVVVFAPISPQRMAAFPDYRLYSLGSPSDIGSGSVVDAATLLNAPLRPFVIPRLTYGATTPDPVVTVAVDTLLVARSDLDPSLVYDLINEIRRLRPALAASRPGLFEQLAESFDVGGSTFVLHAGTQNFLQRDEPTVYERYSGVAEVVVTLLVGLTSAIFAGLRILKMRRKNRIDRYYSAALSIRDSIDENSSAEERRNATSALLDLQDSAFGQLVDEKLAADESFRIFITLSDDVMRRLELPEQGQGQ